MSAEANKPWLHVVGIGEDGAAGLSRQAMQALQDADVIIGGDRHHALMPDLSAERIAWPSPFKHSIDKIMAQRGRQVAILVTGDPLWYSAGALLQRHVAPDEIRYHPQLSAFQWAAARMGWSLADVETVTVHGRPAGQIIPHIAPGVRLLVLTQDASTPATIAKLLNERGFGASELTVLAALGGPKEQRFDGLARDWTQSVPEFHTMAIQCNADQEARCFSRQGGLPDDAFEHDGQMTKRVVRAATLSSLQPYPDALLWDIGAGCGSVSIEWMRAVRGGRAIAIEPDQQRRAMMERNALALGTPRLSIVEGEAPHGLADLEMPDAIFIGGGLTDDGVFDAAWSALRPMGILVANAVTLESEAKLFDFHETHGGRLDRISASEMVHVGRYRGFKPFMSVTQWTVQKP